ncbi:MAG TPA: universal stress protein [Sporichthya sp.]|nr:universal stress protein [Sporichthya sp.]
MERFVTVGVDGSSGGRRALTWAVRHALATGATVDIVTAYKPEPLTYTAVGTDGQDLARRFAAERQDLDLREVLAHFPAGQEPAIRRRVLPGDPVDVLLEAAWTADLLVLGSHGRGQLATTLLGSVSEACVRRGVTPVLIVPAHDRTAGQKGADSPLTVPTSATA